jgi:hypothetical protein
MISMINNNLMTLASCLKKADSQRNTRGETLTNKAGQRYTFSQIGEAGKDDLIEMRTILNVGDHPEFTAAVKATMRYLQIADADEGAVLTVMRFLRGFMDDLDGRKDLVLDLKALDRALPKLSKEYLENKFRKFLASEQQLAPKLGRLAEGQTRVLQMLRYKFLGVVVI